MTEKRMLEGKARAAAYNKYMKSTSVWVLMPQL